MKKSRFSEEQIIGILTEHQNAETIRLVLVLGAEQTQ